MNERFTPQPESFTDADKKNFKDWVSEFSKNFEDSEENYGKFSADEIESNEIGGKFGMLRFAPFLEPVGIIMDKKTGAISISPKFAQFIKYLNKEDLTPEMSAFLLEEKYYSLPFLLEKDDNLIFDLDDEKTKDAEAEKFSKLSGAYIVLAEKIDNKELYEDFIIQSSRFNDDAKAIQADSYQAHDTLKFYSLRYYPQILEKDRYFPLSGSKREGHIDWDMYFAELDAAVRALRREWHRSQQARESIVGPAIEHMMQVLDASKNWILKTHEDSEDRVRMAKVLDDTEAFLNKIMMGEDTNYDKDKEDEEY